MSEWPGNFEVKQSGKNTWDFEVRKKPHYKAVNITKKLLRGVTYKSGKFGITEKQLAYSYNGVFPIYRDNGRFLNTKQYGNHDYQWNTSNGNVYKYTLEQ